MLFSRAYIESYSRPPHGSSSSFKIFLSHRIHFSPSYLSIKSFTCNTYGPPRKSVLIPNSLSLTFSGMPLFAQFWCNVSPFRINTCKNVSRQTTLSTFRINTYEKRGVGEGAFPPSSNQSFPCYSLAGAREPVWTSLPRVTEHRSRVTARRLAFSLPRYLLTSLPLAALRAPLATLFHPWHASVSANTSSPISIGAKKSRAPFAFRRTPSRPSLATSVLCESRFTRTSIAGSKLVQDTVK